MFFRLSRFHPTYQDIASSVCEPSRQPPPKAEALHTISVVSSTAFLHMESLSCGTRLSRGVMFVRPFWLCRSVVCCLPVVVFLCNLDCPGSSSGDQDSLQLRDPPASGIQGVCHHHPACLFLFTTCFVFRFSVYLSMDGASKLKIVIKVK